MEAKHLWVVYLNCLEYIQLATGTSFLHFTWQDDAGLDEQDDGTHYQAGQSTPNHHDVEPTEVEYSDIDFSVLKREKPTKARENETTETEYTEIKKGAAGERQDNGGEEMLESNEEEEAVIDEDKETAQCIQTKEKEEEDVALYSNVTKLKGQI